MATRSNIVIRNGNSTDYAQLYHHWDGYPTGVGEELLTNFNSLSNFDNVHELAQHINNIDDSYRIETCGLAADIEFLYVLDIQTKTISCYSVFLWDDDVQDIDLVMGNITDEKIQKLVFTANFNDKFENVNIINKRLFY